MKTSFWIGMAVVVIGMSAVARAEQVPGVTNCAYNSSVSKDPGETDQAGHGRVQELCLESILQSVCLVTAYDNCNAAGGTPSNSDPAGVAVGDLPFQVNPFAPKPEVTGYWASCSLTVTCAMPSPSPGPEPTATVMPTETPTWVPSPTPTWLPSPTSTPTWMPTGTP